MRKQVDDNDWEIFSLHYKFLETGHKYIDEGAGGQENFGVCHNFCAREKGCVKKRENHATYLGWVMGNYAFILLKQVPNLTLNYDSIVIN